MQVFTPEGDHEIPCTCCYESRMKSEKQPRLLKLFKVSSLNEDSKDKLFKRDDVMLICEKCDGPLYESLIERHVVQIRA